MDTKSMSMSMSQGGDAQNDKKSKKRSWTPAEEQCLITTLKDIVAAGWKSDNGFRTGYLYALENEIAKAFPGTDLKALPHINSKIHVWKKDYGSLASMLSRSGFGWNDSSSTIDCPDPQVWEMYCLMDTNARTMKRKTWPYYHDWVMIFGKDHATGEHAHSLEHTISNLMSKEKASTPPPVHLDPLDEDMGDTNNYAESENVSFSNGESNTSTRTKVLPKRKRTQARHVNETREDPKMVEMMSAFFSSVHSQIGELITKVGHEHDVSLARKNLFDALSPIAYLTTDQKFDISKVICSNEQWLDIFYGLSIENKEATVQRILTKKW